VAKEISNFGNYFQKKMAIIVTEYSLYNYIFHNLAQLAKFGTICTHKMLML